MPVARSGFPLDFPHDQVDCDDCHDPIPAAFDERYPGDQFVDVLVGIEQHVHEPVSRIARIHVG